MTGTHKHAFAGTMLAGALFAGNAALADDACSGVEYNAAFFIDNQTDYDFKAVEEQRVNVESSVIASIGANTDGLNACFWTSGKVDSAFIIVAYSGKSESSSAGASFEVKYQLNLINGTYEEDAQITQDEDSSVVVSYKSSKPTVTIAKSE